MSFLAGFEIAASGLSAQRTRLTVVSSNLANAETTRTEEGGAYRRRDPVLQARRVDSFQGSLSGAVQAVQVADIGRSEGEVLPRIFDPGHPDADEGGYVEMPNVNVVEEMVNMLTASRGYEANATAFQTLKSMARQALSIGS
ncbi:MAG: flagellar basal-body rod protein FlgC [Bradymonadia bacterium]|jgi:flagellar basal-body rod protein FlgC